MSAPVVRWMRILHERDAHAVTTENGGARGWRPLCQQSDMATDLLLREATNADPLCEDCRRVVASRIAVGVAKSRLARLAERS